MNRPTGPCVLGKLCQHPTLQLSLAHKCQQCGKVVHCLCAVQNNVDDKLICFLCYYGQKPAAIEKQPGTNYAATSQPANSRQSLPPLKPPPFASLATSQCTRASTKPPPKPAMPNMRSTQHIDMTAGRAKLEYSLECTGLLHEKMQYTGSLDCTSLQE
jgi:hypothetical protein